MVGKALSTYLWDKVHSHNARDGYKGSTVKSNIKNWKVFGTNETPWIRTAHQIGWNSKEGTGQRETTKRPTDASAFFGIYEKEWSLCACDISQYISNAP